MKSRMRPAVWKLSLLSGCRSEATSGGFALILCRVECRMWYACCTCGDCIIFGLGWRKIQDPEVAAPLRAHEEQPDQRRRLPEAAMDPWADPFDHMDLQEEEDEVSSEEDEPDGPAVPPPPPPPALPARHSVPETEPDASHSGEPQQHRCIRRRSCDTRKR